MTTTRKLDSSPEGSLDALECRDTLECMRTTIELSDEHRARLTALAAERGTRGFSELVREAIEDYLAENQARRDRVKAALGALGSLSETEAARLEDAVAVLRRTWR